MLDYAPETAYIFEPCGGRPAATLVGVLELVAAVLLLWPGRTVLWAALALVVIGGAVITHLTSLGVEVRNPATGEDDGGLLFVLALAAGLAFVLAVRWRELPFVPATAW
jgi:putative oxidoreductase